MHCLAHRFAMRAARVHSAVLALYTLAALLLTWPLIRSFTTHVPGDGIDDPALAWNLWWIKARLIDQVQLDIFHVDWMFHPIQINLGFYTLTPLNGLLSVPLQTAFTLIIANNLLLLSSFVLSGFGAYLLVRQELRNAQAAALFAGFVYAFASSKLFYASLGQFNIASSQWVPFCVLYLLRLGRATGWRDGLRNALWAGIFLTLQAWSELTYASFLLIFAALVFLWSLLDAIGNPQRTIYLRRRLTSFIGFGCVFLLGISPFLWAMIPDLLHEGDFFASGGGFADDYSADLAGYLLPTHLHPLLGDWVDNFAFPHTLGQQIFIGYSVMLLATIGSIALLRHPAQRGKGAFWLVATLLFWWLTLGERMRWLGTPLPIPGPFELISRLPFFSGNRYPSRYSVMLLVSVAVLAGAGVQYIWGGNKESKRLSDGKLMSSVQSLKLSVAQSLTLGFVALFLLEHLSVPLPLSDFQVPSIYQRLAAEAGDFAVLELPTGWRNGARVLGKSHRLIMFQQWYQTVHGKRRLGGNTSRNPPYKFQYFIDAPLLGDLIALMNAEPASTPANDAIAQVVKHELDAMIARNRPLAPQVLALLGVNYVTVHVEQSPPALLRFIDEALPLTLVEEWHGSDWSGAVSTIRLYAVNPVNAPAWTLNLAEPEGQLALAEGWSTLAADGVRYATRPCADLLLNLPASDGELRLQLLGPQQTATLALNGHSLGARSVPTAEGDALVQIQPGQASAFVDRLRLCFDRSTLITDQVALGQEQRWPIGNTGAAIPHSLVVQSAGKDVGDFAHIWRDGVDVAPNQVGYNLVALDATGTVQASRAFNTLATTTEADAMAAWLQQWPPGTILVGAVRDEASTNLTEAAVQALARIGVATDLRERFRWDHAFIGVVGAPVGSALEAVDLLHPATVHVGVAVDAPVVYGGVGQIHFSVTP